MGVLDIVKSQLDYSNITQWHNAGFKGAGINILNGEDLDTMHAQCTAKTIKFVAPESIVHAHTIMKQTRGDLLIKLSVKIDDTTEMPLHEFIEQNNIRIVTISMSGTCNPSAGLKTYIRDVQKKHNVVFINSAGNDGDDDDHETLGTYWSFDTAMVIGAVRLMGGTTPLRASYSSVGQELDFVNFTLYFNGTSFSAPYTAGMVALIMSRYKSMTYSEAYEYLRSNCKDFGGIGRDVYYGWGLPIMPNVDQMYISFRIGSNVMNVNGETVTLDTAPIIDTNGRTLIPARALAEALGCVVTYDPETKTIIIKK